MLDFLIGNDLLSSLIAFAFILIPAVIVHELGHFLAAKAAKITILEFGIGYPPRIAKLFRWGETEFTLNWIPLGGFVRPFGEDMIRPLSEEEVRKQREASMTQLQPGMKPADRIMQETNMPLSEREILAQRGVFEPKTVNDAKPWPRIVFFAAGAIANLLFAYLVFVVIGLIGIEQPIGSRVFLADVPANSALAEAGFVTNDFIERINGELFTGTRDFFRQLEAVDGVATVDVRRPALDEGPDTLLTLDVQLTPQAAQELAQARAQLVIQSVQANSPAATAGLQPEDIIIGLDNEMLALSDDAFAMLQSINRRNEGRLIPIEIIRDDEIITLQITPRVNPAAGVGHLGAGVVPEFRSESGVIYGNALSQFEYVPLALGDALRYGLDEILNVFTTLFELPVRLLSGAATPEEGRVVSIVAISQLGGEFLQQSIEESQPILILRYMALISIALGITNLLPIPPLDGGRILFVLVEMVRGKPLSARIEEMMLMVGVAFLLSIGVLVIINDIVNPITDSLIR